MPAAKTVNNQPDTTKSANPTTTTKDKPAKNIKRTASLPPGSFLSPYQEKRRLHWATLPAWIIKKQFNLKAVALKLLKDQERTTQQTLPPPKEVEEGEQPEEDKLKKFLPWKEILTKHSDGWNPYTERKHIKVLKKGKQLTKESTERNPKKPYKIPKINQSKPQPSGLKAKPYKQKTKKGENKSLPSTTKMDEFAMLYIDCYSVY
ncbi:hypothetical protein PTTG_28090 [Puccinia triticina 1-1 BBBD Race 1]|uniref:Uncharacterized protein n=1 Tax=Puccinia triticina (isolate 1-1 / race 1 (BBBD)) TaxID=630390 RepID=A0A180GF54_PUCT1|nr:hypothetical protein PTTG_28090 [Puccinia triticina 1-1 BBBD Race 1]